MCTQAASVNNIIQAPHLITFTSLTWNGSRFKNAFELDYKVVKFLIAISLFFPSAAWDCMTCAVHDENESPAQVIVYVCRTAFKRRREQGLSVSGFGETGESYIMGYNGLDLLR